MRGAIPTSPYKGLIPYSEKDAPFFFGRKAVQEIIIANLMASRLTILYGPSGVGKSSVLRAGVAYHLNALSRGNLAESDKPKLAVVVFSSWRDNLIAGLMSHIRDAIAVAVNDEVLEQVPTSNNFNYDLRVWTKLKNIQLLIILDQFEEYFVYHAQDGGVGSFADEFSRAVNDPDLRVNFLISIREDALAKLDRFEGRIPNLFDNYLRIEHLDYETARAAIESPVRCYNDMCVVGGREIKIESGLVEAVLEQARTEKAALDEAERSDAWVEAAEADIEATHLQLMMTRLWDEEMRAGSQVLRLETLRRLGGAEHIMQAHLEAAMSELRQDEQEVAARIFRYLVTPSGTKIAHTLPDLAYYSGSSQAELAPILAKLSSGAIRILRSAMPPPNQPEAICYEISHNVLVPAILDWQSRYWNAQELLQKKLAELEALLDVNQAITSTLDFDKVLDQILNKTLVLTRAEAGYVHLYDKSSEELVIRASLGPMPDQQFTRINPGEGIIGSVAIKKRYYLTNSELAVPLLVGDEAIGVLTITSSQMNAFTQEEVRLVQLLANSAVVAIQNAKQYEALQKAHQDLQQSIKRQMAAEAMASLGTVTSNLLHRIGNTIGLIPTLVDEVRDSIGLKDDETSEVLEDIKKGAQETLKMTGQMRIALKSKATPKKPLEPQVILKTALESVTVPANIMVRINCPPDLPDIIGSQQLFDAFGNLIKNAIDASPRGGIITLTAKTVAGAMELSVSDTGQGISPEAQERVFDLFYTTKKEGLGLGLWLARTIVEEHGGSIAIESVMGEGTTISVLLPVWRHQD